MKFTVQHLKCGAHFWIPHCKDTLQKLMIIQRIPNGKMPCLIVISWKKWDRKPRKENTFMLHGYFSNIPNTLPSIWRAVALRKDWPSLSY